MNALLAINVEDLTFPSQSILDNFIGNDPLAYIERTKLLLRAKDFLNMALQLISDIYSSPVLTVAFVSSFAFVAVRLVRRLKRV